MKDNENIEIWYVRWIRNCNTENFKELTLICFLACIVFFVFHFSEMNMNNNDNSLHNALKTLRQLYNYVLEAIATRPKYVESIRSLDTSKHPITPTSSQSNDVVPMEDGTGGENGVVFRSSQVVSTITSNATSSTPPTVTTTTTAVKSSSRTNSRRSEAWGPTPVTYRERLGGYLHPRDMRRLVTPFSATNEPELIVRRHVMLLNFDPLRAIVLRDRLLVLVPDGADSILERLAERIQVSGMESVFGEHENTTKDTLNKETANKPSKASTNYTMANEDEEEFFESKKRSRAIANFAKHCSDDEGERQTNSKDCDISLENDEWNDLKGKGWINLPFELQSVDAVLHTVSSMLTEEAGNLQEYVYSEMDHLLHASSSVASDQVFDVLRTVKSDISEMLGRCQGFIRAINVVLDEDEDLALMNLSRLITHPERFIQPVSEDILHEESDEPELILEAYLQQSTSNANALEMLRSQITTTEDLMNMKLDKVRNRLLYINTMVSLVTMCVGTGSLLGSIFGMNLYSGIEDSPTAFGIVVHVIGWGILVSVLGFGYLFTLAGNISKT
jgi:magnesium transporter